MCEYLGMSTKIRKKTKKYKIYLYALEGCESNFGGWYWKECDFVDEYEIKIFESEDFEI